MGGGGGGRGVDWKGRSLLQLQGNYRTQKKSLTINRSLALPYGLGSLYMVNHCNRKKGPAQKMVLKSIAICPCAKYQKKGKRFI